MIKNFMDIVKKNKLFEGINPSELVALLRCLNTVVREYGKSEYIALAGERFDSLGIIVKGEAAVLKEDENGNRTIMALLKPGDIFGEMVAFSPKTVWPDNVYVQERCTVCYIPSIKITSACNNACQWHTVLIQNLLKALSEKALMLNKKVEYLTIKSMRGRICAFLLEQYKLTGQTTINLHMNRNELADFLNVSRPSMSREICKMRDEGIVDFHKSTFRILDINALKL